MYPEPRMKNSQKIAFIVVFLLPFAGLVLNWAKWASGCFHALDLGIYQQAILDLAFTPSWNPLNTVRGIPIFADHFDPILLLAAGFQRIAGPDPWVPLVFEFLFYYTGGILVLGFTRKKPFPLRLILVALWFFCTGMAVAFRFPVHPTTWSAVPLLFLAHSFRERKSWWSLFWMNLLCLFKEFFPLCFLFYGVYLAGSRRFRESLPVLINGALWVLLDFVVRPRLMPDFYGHGNGLLKAFLDHPFADLLAAGSNFDWKGTFTALFPFLILIPVLVRAEKDKSWWVDLLAFTAPVFGIQFLYGNASYQYGAPVAAVFLSIAVFSDSSWFPSADRLNRWTKRALWILVIWLAGDFLVRAGTFFVPRENRCRFDRAKAGEFTRLGMQLDSLPGESRILASGGLVPVLVAPDRRIYQYGIWSKIQEEYEVIAIGRNNTSDLFPFGPEHFEKVIETCRPFASEILVDSRNAFVARGTFKEDCLHQRHDF